MPEPYIVFKVAGSSYGVRSTQVQQVGMIENVTFVPNAPAFIEGIVYLRGQVVPVISLRRRFGLEKIPYDLQSRLVVTSLENRVVGLAVDSAREFITLTEAQIQPLPENLAALPIEYLEGVVSLNGRLILLIDLAQLLKYEKEELLAIHAPAEPSEGSKE